MTNTKDDDFYFNLPEACEELDKSLAELKSDILYAKELPLEEKDYTKEDEEIAEHLDYLDEANKEDSRFIFFEHQDDKDEKSPIIGVTVMNGKDKILVNHDFEKPIDTNPQKQDLPEKDLDAISKTLESIDSKIVFCDRKSAREDIKLLKKQYSENLAKLSQWKQQELEDFKGNHKELNFNKSCSFPDIIRQGSTNKTISTLFKTFVAGFVGDLKNRPSRVANAAFKKHIAADYSNRLQKIVEDYRNGKKEAWDKSYQVSGHEDETYDPQFAPKRFSAEYRKLPLEERLALNYAKKSMDIWLVQYQKAPDSYKRPTVGDFTRTTKEKLKGIQELNHQKAREQEIPPRAIEVKEHIEARRRDENISRQRTR